MVALAFKAGSAWERERAAQIADIWGGVAEHDPGLIGPFVAESIASDIRAGLTPPPKNEPRGKP
jgi:hypothetical protein